MTCKNKPRLKDFKGGVFCVFFEKVLQKLTILLLTAI